MLQFLSIGLFLLKKNPIRIQTNGIAIFIDQLIQIVYTTNSEYDLDRLSELLDLHFDDLTPYKFMFYKNLVATRRSNIKLAQ